MPPHVHKLMLLAALAALAAPPAVWGQPDRSALVEEIRAAYQALDYDAAEAQALTALATYTDFTPEQLIDIHTILGFVNFSQNELDEARQQFEAALSINPNLELDPLLVSPKILEFFAEVKSTWTEAQATAIPEPGQVRYVMVEDPRAGAAMRSLVLPGWGQHYKGEKTKGWVLIGLWGATASGTVLAHLRRTDAQSQYDDALTQADIADRFDTLNRWHKIRNNLALTAAGVWAYSYVDALLFHRPALARNRLVTITPGPAPSYAHVYVRLRF